MLLSLDVIYSERVAQYQKLFGKKIYSYIDRLRSPTLLEL